MKYIFLLLRASETSDEYVARLQKQREYHANLSPDSREVRLAQMQQNSETYRSRETTQRTEQRQENDRLAKARKKKGYV